jgi:hypothetical protein
MWQRCPGWGGELNFSFLLCGFEMEEVSGGICWMMAWTANPVCPY